MATRWNSARPTWWIEYLYPEPPSLAHAACYLDAFAVLIERARNAGAQVVALKMPVSGQFRRMISGEDDFNRAIVELLSARRTAFHDFSSALDDPRYYFDTDHLNRAGLIEFFNRHLKAIFLSADLSGSSATAPAMVVARSEEERMRPPYLPPLRPR